MKNKYYVVLVGFQKGIYDQWEDCLHATCGASGNVFRGLKTLDEAIDYIEGSMDDGMTLITCIIGGKRTKYPNVRGLISHLERIRTTDRRGEGIV